MPRRPIGDAPMTSTERSRRCRERRAKARNQTQRNDACNETQRNEACSETQRNENAELRARLREAEEALRAERATKADNRAAQAMADLEEEWARYYLPQIERNDRDSGRILMLRNGVMSKADYNKIRSCLHSDHLPRSEEERERVLPRYEEAFRLFNEAKIALLNEKEHPVLGAPLPRTVNELLARRKNRR